jgi:hypothetical protein
VSAGGVAYLQLMGDLARLLTVVHTQLEIHVAKSRSMCIQGDEKLSGDARVGRARQEKAQHPQFPACQRGNGETGCVAVLVESIQHNRSEGAPADGRKFSQIRAIDRVV